MNDKPTTDPVFDAAEALVRRHGKEAVSRATERAEALARQGRWPEHDLALRVLTLVERLLKETGL